MVWGNFLIAIAAAALKTPTRNGYNAQGVNLTLLRVEESSRSESELALWHFSGFDAAGLCARVRACAGAAEYVHTYIHGFDGGAAARVLGCGFYLRVCSSRDWVNHDC